MIVRDFTRSGKGSEARSQVVAESVGASRLRGRGLLDARHPHEDRRRRAVHRRFVGRVVLDVVVIDGPLVLEEGERVRLP